MKVSLNKIRYAAEHYETPDLVPDGVDALVQKIGAQLGAVEEVVDYGSKFDGVIIVKVVSCDKHPNADKLSVCKIDAGGQAKEVKRDKDGLVQVVCGAPNVRAGMLAAWLPPGATVPSTAGKEPLVLEARELRGVISNGMLASGKELGISDNHDGLLEVDKDVEPGTSFAKAYRAEGEMIIDIENKMFTHRPDCFGVMGVTREIAGIQQKAFKSPDWYVPNPVIPSVAEESRRPSAGANEISRQARDDNTLQFSVRNELPELVPRFTAIAMSNIEVKPSPVWLQIVLSEVGIRPINNVVDYTNFWMLETGQPLHAYDYDKVKALSDGEPTLVIRQPKKSEKIKLLNGKTIEPRAEAIMIAADKQLIGVGGVMGGSETEVDANTKNIILECANFDMYSIRRTSMAHGLFTDAVTRFTKGQSPLQCLAVLAKAVESIAHDAAGKVASQPIDDKHDIKSYPPVKVPADFINARLGLGLSATEMKKLLENVEFKVEVQGGELTVTAPFWRIDIEIPEDIVEEVGRLYGYDHLPLELPKRDLTPAPKNALMELKSKIRAQLAKAGANEVLTYSFVHGDLLEKVGQDKSQAFQISNALSPDLQYYRLSLLPSLLEKVHPNIKAGYDEFALFEIGKAHVVGEPDINNPNVPKEVNAVSLVYAAKKQRAGAPYYQARYYLTNLLSSFQLRKFTQLESLKGADLYNNPWIEQMVAPFEPQRSAVLRDHEGLIWGVVGEFKPSVRGALKLPTYSAGFEIDPLLFNVGMAQPYSPLYRFPSLKQDITLKIASKVQYQEFYDFIDEELAVSSGTRDLPASTHIELIDIYQGADVQHKNVTFRVTLNSDIRTLTDKEATIMLDDVAAAAKTKFGAERI